MASFIGCFVFSGLPINFSPKIIPSSQTKFKVSSLTTQNGAGSTSIAVPQRRSGNYNPNIWDHSFIQSLKNDYAGDIYIDRAEKLKEEVRKLFDTTVNPLAKLKLIDNLQHLGIAYHFDKEIEDSLSNISNNKDDILLKKDLHSTSLLFKLLREHGFEVSQDVFQFFKVITTDNVTDIKGMLSLYEASYLGFEEEEILDKARDFTTKFLKEYLKEDEINPILKEKVVHSLEIPRHWRMKRLESYWYIDIYERQGDVNPRLLELAKLDFNLVQSVLQTNVQNMSRWWIDLELNTRLSYARDRLMEHFFWTVGTFYEPQFSKLRECVTKVNCFITAIDDTYDVYGSLDELRLFTDAINRWELNATQNLPEYMKVLISALFKTIEEIACEILEEEGVNFISYLQKGWADLCNSYLVEAEWYHNGYTPTLDEYLNNAWISISNPLMLLYSYFSINEEITNEALNGVYNYIDIMRSSSMIFRLANDLGTSKPEMEKGDVPKSIQCYMLEKGVSEEVAREHIRGLISEIWKTMNKECASPSPFPRIFSEACLNGVRMSQCMYQHGDGHGSPEHETRHRILLSLIQPIPLA